MRLKTLDYIVKRPLIAAIALYQKLISPDHSFWKIFFRRRVCIFTPTCSEYAMEAISKKPLHQAIFLILKRLGKCHPWNTPKEDKII